MASNALAAMLDELMGRDRNLAPTEKKNELHWEDSEVYISIIQCMLFYVDHN